jgi:teichuronic acid biosynthesis glycosyltransferase TuaC
MRIISRIKNANIIPNGVDLSVFRLMKKVTARKELGLDIKKNIILFAADPERNEKNYGLAKESVRLLNNSQNKLLVVFGISHTEMYLYFNAVDLLLLTSSWEGSPNIVKEAMSCNCPIVATDVGDVRWLFGSESGYFICSFKPEDVAGKIKMALVFAEKYGRTNGRQRIIELGLDDETIAKKVIELYKQVIYK